MVLNNVAGGDRKIILVYWGWAIGFINVSSTITFCLYLCSEKLYNAWTYDKLCQGKKES